MPQRLSPLLTFLTAFLTSLLAVMPCAAQEPKAKIDPSPSAPKVAAGGQFVIALQVAYDEGWHSWPNQPVIPPELGDFEAIPTTVAKSGDAKWYTVHADFVQWPQAHETTSAGFTGTPMKVLTYGGTVTVYVPISLASDAPLGKQTIAVEYAFQACNDATCVAPTSVTASTEIEVTATGTGDTAAARAPKAGTFTDFEPAVWDKIASAKPTASAQPAAPTATPADAAGTLEPGVINLGPFGIDIIIDTRGSFGLVLIVLCAIVGGILLNFTPCVLPVIPLKIMGLQHAAKTPGRFFILGLSSCLGIIAFWAIIGLVIALSTSFKTTSELSSYWWFNGAIGLFILAMSAGLFGAFNVGLPNWVYAINPRHETLHGSFFWGVMAAVLSTPCTAPLAGSAAAWATTQSQTIAILVFTAVGVGMALPYFIISLNAKFVNWLPRAGPGSELLKQVLGLLMVAVAVFFIANAILILISNYPYLATTLSWWIIAAVIAIAGLWATYRTFAITPSFPKRFAILLVSAALFAPTYWWAQRSTEIEKRTFDATAAAAAIADAHPSGEFAPRPPVWTPYSAAAFAHYRKTNVVVIRFTAVWCLSCKPFDAMTNSDEALKQLGADGVIALKASLDTNRAIGWALLRDELKQQGIPYVAVYKPGDDTPVFQSNAYTLGQLLDAVQRANPVTPAKTAAGN